MKARANAAAKGAIGRAGCVCLVLTHPTAQEVCIAGSFNDWHPSVTPMIRLEDGRWAKELALPPGRYEYRFVVDGQWVDDPAATELVPNSFGTANAVLVVEDHKAIGTARSAAGTPTTKGRAATRNAPAQRQACWA
jgi:1,4-alpha-glucan branching enzyme